MKASLKQAILVAAGGLALAAGCSSESEQVASSSEAITVGANTPAVLNDMHYADVVEARFPGLGAWHWVTAFNNCSAGLTTDPGWVQCDVGNWIGWSVSSDLTPTGWTPNTPPAGWEQAAWVPPGAPSGGGIFDGWGGDPTIATIGNPPDGTQVMMASIAESYNNGITNSDIATLLSTDGGQSWNNPTYVSQPAGGVGADQPQIVSNPSPPYSTFIAWTNNTTDPPVTGWFTSIDNTTLQPGSSSSAPGWTGSAKPILGMNDNGCVRPKMAVGSVQGCTDGPHEMVYFAWSDAEYGHGKCRDNGGDVPDGVHWSMTFYDNTTGVWAPQWWPLAYDPNYPYCIGSGNQYNNDNLANPYLAADVDGGVAIVHNVSSPARGTRIEVDHFLASCSGTTVNGQVLGPQLSPDPCYTTGQQTWCPPGHQGGNGADGGNVINDQWGPRVAFQMSGSTEYLLVTWYDTSGDSTNSMERVNGAINASGVLGNPFYVGTIPTIYQLSDGSGQIPWSDSLSWSLWADYQGIGVDTINHTFLAAWGGDARVGTVSGVWTAPVYTP